MNYKKNIMKTKAVSFFVLTIIVMTGSVNAQNLQKQGSDTQTNKSQVPPVALTTPADSLQYTLGAFLGQWLVANGFSVTKPQIFNRGFEDVLLKRPLAVTDSTIVKRIAAYQISMQNERNRQLEDQLFAALRGKQGVGALPDGRQIARGSLS